MRMLVFAMTVRLWFKSMKRSGQEFSRRNFHVRKFRKQLSVVTRSLVCFDIAERRWKINPQRAGHSKGRVYAVESGTN